MDVCSPATAEIFAWVIIAGILTLLGTMGVLLESLTILTVFGLVLSAVWQIVVGFRLYKLG